MHASMFQYNNVLQSASGNEQAGPTKLRQRERERGIFSGTSPKKLNWQIKKVMKYICDFDTWVTNFI
jgi:hypothetical protein